MYLSYGPMKLWLKADDYGITNIDFVDAPLKDVEHSKKTQEHLTNAKKELLAYFEGNLTTFNTPIHFKTGTSFQHKVWQALIEIPYGDIKSYQDVAIMIDSPKAQQAVGQANRNNPIPIIVPCHRVIGKSGKLVGYSGNNPNGLEMKQFLLDLELKNGQLF